MNKEYLEALNITKATEKYTGIDLTIIKQALLKAQQQKSVIKNLKKHLQEQNKMLKIIKKKDVDIYSLRRCKTVEEYNINFAINEYQELTKEEFDLLKRYCENE